MFRGPGRLAKHSGYGRTHWDLFLASGRALATWRLEVHRGRWSVQAAAAHRRRYLRYRGLVRPNRGRLAAGIRVYAQMSRKHPWSFELRKHDRNGAVILSKR